MTDKNQDLHTRIAAAIWNRQATCKCDRCVPCCEADADAVIRELGLERQAHYDPDCAHHRYATDWIADD